MIVLGHRDSGCIIFDNVPCLSENSSDAGAILQHLTMMTYSCFPLSGPKSVQIVSMLTSNARRNLGHGLDRLDLPSSLS